MEQKAFFSGEPWEEARRQGEHLDTVLVQMSRQCDLETDKDGELLWQEAFLRAMLESEERKAEVQETMLAEQEKLRGMIGQLKRMGP